MATEQKPPSRPGRLTEAERRAARRAEQLRANLRRRKGVPEATDKPAGGRPEGQA